MRSLKLAAVLLLFSLVLSGCFGGTNKTPQLSGKDEVGTVSVSFIGNTTGSKAGPQSKVLLSDLTPLHQGLYKEPFDDPALVLEDSFTPRTFVVGLLDVELARPDLRVPLTFTKTIQSGEASGFGIPTHFDLVDSRDILQAKYVTKTGIHTFDQLCLALFGSDHEPYPFNNWVGYSEVEVDMGEKYRDVRFANEESAHGTIHTFELMDLVPFKDQDRLEGVSIIFDKNVPAGQEYILNPDGNYVRINPYFWDDSRRWGFSGYIIYRPNREFDLSTGNSLVFEWDLVDLIQVYKNGDDYLATLRLDNPFPVSFYLDDAPPVSQNPVDTGIVEDVTCADIRYFDIVNREIVVQWLNPASSNFEQVQVYRKMDSPFVVGCEEGTLVYSGRFPQFVEADVERYRHYYYMIVVEDFFGNRSPGIKVDIEALPPDIVQLEFEPADPITTNVGSTVELRALGKLKTGEYVRASPVWKVIGDIGILELTYGDRNVFSAGRPGEGLIEVELSRDGKLFVERIAVTVLE